MSERECVEVISDSDARVRTVLTRRSSSSSSPASSSGLQPNVSCDRSWRLTISGSHVPAYRCVLQWYSMGGPVLPCRRALKACAASRGRHMASSVGAIRRAPLAHQSIHSSSLKPCQARRRTNIRPAPFGPPLPPPRSLPASVFAARPTPLRSSSTPLVFVIPNDAPVRAQRRASSAPNGVPRPRPTACLARVQWCVSLAPNGVPRSRSMARLARVQWRAQRRRPFASNNARYPSPTAHAVCAQRSRPMACRSHSRIRSGRVRRWLRRGRGAKEPRQRHGLAARRTGPEVRPGAPPRPRPC
jgi:hypothetical protein